MLKAGMGPGYDDHSPESDTYLQLSSFHSPELYLTEMSIIKPGHPSLIENYGRIIQTRK